MKRLSLNYLLNNNRFVIIFAGLVALISWIAVAINSTEQIERTISGVPINLDMQTEILSHMGLSFIGVEEEFATVLLSGVRTVVGQFEVADFTLSVNVTGATQPGTYDLEIEVVGRPPGDFEILGLNPPILAGVLLDHIDGQMFEVSQEIVGLASAPGYMVDIPRLTPSETVWVTGPRTELERIDRVAIIAELEGALNSPWAQQIPLTLLDAAGQPIYLEGTQLELEYQSLTLQIPVLRVATLPLVVDLLNIPDGFPELALRSHMNKSATTLTIAGPISSMANHNDWRPGSINLRSLSIENNFFVFDISLPSEQFVNVDNLPALTIEFDTENWDTAVFDIPAESITMTTPPPDLEVNLQTLTLNNVTFVGDQEDIANLSLEDIVVEVNLDDRELTLGTQPHPIRISVPGGGMVWPVDEGGNLIAYIHVTEIE